jgi:hypothetical protein
MVHSRVMSQDTADTIHDGSGGVHGTDTIQSVGQLEFQGFDQLNGGTDMTTPDYLFSGHLGCGETHRHAKGVIMFAPDEAIHPFVLRGLDGFVPLIIDVSSVSVQPEFAGMEHDVMSVAPQVLEVLYVRRGELLEVSARFLSVGLEYHEYATCKAAAESRIREYALQNIGSGTGEYDYEDIPELELAVLKCVPSEGRRSVEEFGKGVNELIALLVACKEDGELISLDQGSLLFFVGWYYVSVNELLGRCFAINNANACYIAQGTRRDLNGS